MPKHVMVSTDIGNICSVSNNYLRFDEPNSMLAAMSFGNCGYALPALIGAKLGRRSSGRGLCGRRRLVHELPGTADLRARAHSGDGGGVP